MHETYFFLFCRQSQPIKTSYIKTKTDGAGYSPPSAYQYGSPSGAYQPYGTGPPKSPYASKTNYKVPSNILEGKITLSF